MRIKSAALTTLLFLTLTLTASAAAGSDTASDPAMVVASPQACSTITINPASLPSGTQGTAYNQTLTASGGTTPYNFSLISGLLPSGVNLSGFGILSGTPTASGIFSNLTVKVTDSNGCSATRVYTLVISPVSCPAITVSPAALLTATRGSAFTQTITASGGTTPYTFSVAGGSLPAGVNLSNGGMLSGTPTLPGNFDFTVKVIDETGCMGSVNYLLIVACPTIIISPSSLPGGVLNVAYSQTLAASSNTASTFTFSLAAGNLPAGLTLSLGGIISGTPTQAGNFPITVRAADTSGCTGTLTYTLTINNPTPALSGINPSSAVAGSAAFTLSVTGSNFVNGATVQWNGANRTTSFVNNTQLTAMIPASDLTAATTASVRVVNPAPSAGPSNALPFTVIAPVTADLVITQSATPNQNQSVVTYSITITNNGPNAATSAVVSDNLPAGVTFATCAATGGVCGGAGNNRTVNFSTLAAGASATITLTANVICASTGNQSFSNTASVTSAVTDPNGGNNTTTPATITINCAPKAVVTLSGGKSAFAFGTVPAAREPNSSPPSDTFAIDNTGNAPLAVSFTVRRTGGDVSSGKITNPDDSLTFPIRLINADGSETPVTTGQAQIPAGQRRNFRLLFDPKIPAPAGKTVGFSAVQIMPDVITSELMISSGSDSSLRVPLSGSLDARARLINPLGPRLGPLVAISRSGDELTVELSAYDPNNDIYLVTYQFLNSAGAQIGQVLGADVDLKVTPLLNGQSFTIVKKFKLSVEVSKVRVTLYDQASNESALSGAPGAVPGRVVNVSAASFRNAPLASEAIAAGFGAGLATSVSVAGSLPLPTTLAGTQVFVRDSRDAERPAPLFFVSPNQINYLIPEGTAPGVATVVAASGDQVVATETRQIDAVSPGLFSANASGSDVAAAVALRVRADGSLSYEPVAQHDGTKFIAKPIDLGPDSGQSSDQVFLALFGTGLRWRSSLANVTAKIGGIDAEVLYAGAQGGFAGLDQVNLRVPRSLIGHGDVDIVLMVDGKQANVVRVSIR